MKVGGAMPFGTLSLPTKSMPNKMAAPSNDVPSAGLTFKILTNSTISPSTEIVEADASPSIGIITAGILYGVLFYHFGFVQMHKPH